MLFARSTYHFLAIENEVHLSSLTTSRDGDTCSDLNPITPASVIQWPPGPLLSQNCNMGSATNNLCLILQNSAYLVQAWIKSKMVVYYIIKHACRILDDVGVLRFGQNGLNFSGPLSQVLRSDLCPGCTQMHGFSQGQVMLFAEIPCKVMRRVQIFPRYCVLPGRIGPDG